MCGICGVIDYNKNSCIEPDLLHQMCAQLKHRGPDDEGIFVNKESPSVGLGHRRLSIIDLSAAGHQPMSNEDNSIWIIFNGEIYNFSELRSKLKGRGHRFKSVTDTECIIHLYEEYGQDCVKYLRGMFAFAIWDSKNKSLLLARDRVGKKPLLYHHNNNKFSFASEFTSLLSSGLIAKEINLIALNYYLTFGYVPAPLTIYKDVFKLPPAHTLLLNNNRITLKKYWELDYSEKLDISESEAQEEVISHLREAVKIRLHSDVPLGAFLSGGIDSSTIVYLMSELSSNKVKTFSVGFDEKEYNELRYARTIAERFNTEHHEFIVKPKALEILPMLIEHYGEPFADSSCIPTYYVAQQTKRFVTVALNGDGGDETFAGYARYPAMQLANQYNKLPGILKNICKYTTSFLPDSINPKNDLRKIKRFFAAAILPEQLRYLRWISICNEEFRKEIYAQRLSAIASSNNPLTIFSPFFNSTKAKDLIDKLLLIDTNTYLPYDLLVKIDITSMANSLEARSPFLDQEFMEFAAKLPAEFKVNKMVNKYILKKAIAKALPHKNIYRKKMGFGLPIGGWLKNELSGFLSSNILSKKSLQRGYFRPEAIKNIYRQHLSGKKDYSYQLWALLCLELWHQRFID